MHVRPLKRVLGVWAVVAFGLTNQIAAGLFFVSTQIQQTAAGVGDLVPWLMLAGGGITLLTVAAYRYFFASGLVGAGGEYTILRAALGAKWAFIATLLAWFGVTGSLGTLAYVATRFLASACASIGWSSASGFLLSVPGTLACGLFLLWSAWAVHVRGVRLAAAVSVASMIVVLATCLIVIGYGFATTPAHFAHALQARSHLSLAQLVALGRVSSTNTFLAALAALPILFFGYVGLSTATQTGAEAVDARRVLSTGVLVAVAVVTVVYTAFTAAIYHAVPWEAIRGLAMLRPQETTATGLVSIMMPRWLGSLMNFCVAFIVVKTFLPLYLAQSRWIYAWGCDDLVPLRFARTHERFQTPVPALTMSAVLASLSLLESIALGYVFGVSLRVFSVMAVFFSMGLAIVLFPKTAPQLYRSNSSGIARRRSVQIAVGVSLLVFSTWFAAALAYGARDQPPWLQPAVQAALVAVLGLLMMRWAKLRRARGRTALDTARRNI